MHFSYCFIVELGAEEIDVITLRSEHQGEERLDSNGVLNKG